MRVFSFAKINLNLRVIGKRDDGYHLLQSVFYPLDFLYDEIMVSYSDLGRDTVEVNRSNYIIEFEESLIIKSLALMRESLGFNNYFHITLNKNIPIGAGLGGGSSNAGAIICAIDELLKLKLSIQEKVNIGVQIGADVPFFIYNRPCIIEGIGEKITIIEKPKSYFVLLITPNFDVSTPMVYKGYASAVSKGKLKHSNEITHTNLILESELAKNDLQPMAEQIQPKITELLDKLSASDGCVANAISGSGSSCFGIFQDMLKMKAAVENLKEQFKEYQFFTGKC